MAQRYSLESKDIPEEIRSSLGQIHRLILPTQGDTSAVAIADTANGRFVIKRSYGEQFSCWLKQEYKVLEALTRTSIPTPHPYAFVQRETTEGPESWLVMSYIPGEPLIVAIENETNQEMRWNLLNVFGSILTSVHHQPFPSDFQSDRNLECAEYNFFNYDTEGSAELLDQLRQHRPLPISSALIHGDFTVDNVLILDGKVTGIIDWAGGGIGDPRYDLALAICPKGTNLFHVPEDRQAFFEGYGLFNLSDFDYKYFVELYEFF